MKHTLGGYAITEINALIREVTTSSGRVVQRKVSVQIEIPGSNVGHPTEPDTLRVAFPIWDNTLLAATFLESQLPELLATSPMYADALEKFYAKENLEKCLFAGMGVGREVNKDLKKGARRDVLDNTVIVIWQKIGAFAEGRMWVGDFVIDLHFDQTPSEKHTASGVVGWSRPVVPQRRPMKNNRIFAV